MASNFFPPRPELFPKIYAYELIGVKTHKGLIKVGYTTRSVKERVEEQLKTSRVKYKIICEDSAMRNDGSAFRDSDVHNHLISCGVERVDGEWFKCNLDTIRAAINAVRERIKNVENRTQSFKMRPEQNEAVEKTARYVIDFKKENPGKTPRFLWNAKMRFGKTFATYQLAKKMGWKKLLVLTFKPAVRGAWEEDLNSHLDFAGWQFICRNGLTIEEAEQSKPIVCFGSFQDYMGKNEAGGIKAKNQWVHDTKWDCVVFDEYHYGAWRDNAQDLFESEDKEERKFAEGVGMDYFKEENMPIRTDCYLYLSGTPFRAIASGEFIEEQIFNWTYSDEQKAKENWSGPNNPYESLPRMILLTYQLPDAIREIAMKGEFNQFDLNVFFSAEGSGSKARFKYADEVQKWLDMIRGAFLPTEQDKLKMGAEKPPLPFSDVRILNVLSHSFWFLPSVASCHAMKNLLDQKQNKFYHDYKVVVAAGIEAGIGFEALTPVKEAMDDPLKTKTITLSCGKLTTGVSVSPWTGILMLRNSSSPETYFQAAFRVQTPWTISNPDSHSPNKTEILKRECYVFDFAPDRALKQIADYSCRLNINESNPEAKVEEFIHFLPVLAFDGSSMKQINAAGILEMAMSGTTATLLARRWESALLVNVDDDALRRLLNNEAALKALMSIEGFRNLNQDIETIINKSDIIKKAKLEANEKELTPKEKKELTDEEKENKGLRKQIQEKLIKFATRIPVFMYLTDYRERSLKDVIMQIEPGLFKKVTGLSIQDFDLLVHLDLFNGPLMNDAVYKFKRYEDSSLSYLGVNKHEGETVVGLYDTTIQISEY